MFHIKPAPNNERVVETKGGKKKKKLTNINLYFFMNQNEKYQVLADVEKKKYFFLLFYAPVSIRMSINKSMKWNDEWLSNKMCVCGQEWNKKKWVRN